jgi:hypothetical protein
MKIRPFAPLFPVLALALGIGFAPFSLAQDEKKDNNEDEEELQGIEEKSAEDHEKEDEESEAKDKEETIKMMKVFKSLEGEWTGKEVVDYNNDLPGLKNKPDKEWNDTWKGFFTQEGRYFEMTGATTGKMASTYHWTVTYDSNDNEFKAWSFGSTGYSEYEGELSDDGKSVKWSHSNELEIMDVEDTFEFRVDGNSCKAKGETTLISKDGSNSQTYSTHTSTYTRKKVEL